MFEATASLILPSPPEPALFTLNDMGQLSDDHIRLRSSTNTPNRRLATPSGIDAGSYRPRRVTGSGGLHVVVGIPRRVRVDRVDARNENGGLRIG